MTQSPIDEQEHPRVRAAARAASFVAIFMLLVLLLGFDWLKDAAGRAYYETQMPATLTVAAVEGKFGAPDMTCDKIIECRKQLDPFLFHQGQPAQYAGYIAYRRHYPLLPLLVFFLDADGNVISHDYGRH